MTQPIPRAAAPTGEGVRQAQSGQRTPISPQRLLQDQVLSQRYTQELQERGVFRGLVNPRVEVYEGHATLKHDHPPGRSAQERQTIDNGLFDRAHETLSRPGFPLGREMHSFGVNRDLRYDPRRLPPQ